jgi:hypothetical protein
MFIHIEKELKHLEIERESLKFPDFLRAASADFSGLPEMNLVLNRLHSFIRHFAKCKVFRHQVVKNAEILLL